jgi:hypothetical protein
MFRERRIGRKVLPGYIEVAAPETYLKMGGYVLVGKRTAIDLLLKLIETSNKVYSWLLITCRGVLEVG